MIVTKQTPLAEWFNHAASLGPHSERIYIGSRSYKEDRILGVVAYDSWVGNTCCMHMYGEPGFATPNFMWAIFHYPFVVCGFDSVMAMIEAQNVRSLSIATRVGFKLRTIIESENPSLSVHVLVMKKDECRWLERKHVQKPSTAAAA